MLSTIISKLADPSVEKFGHERVELRNVQFDTILLSNWTAGELVQQEIPFTFDDFVFLSSIKD